MGKYKIFKFLRCEMKRTIEGGAFSAAIILAYVVIDTMSYLAMLENKTKNTRVDFIFWVNKYLKTDASQSYQYAGEDLWADHCAKLHCFSSFSNYGEKEGCKKIGHHTIDMNHRYDSTENSKLLLISIQTFIEGIVSAMQNFINKIIKDIQLKKRVDSRIEKVCQQYDYDPQS